MIQRIIRIMSRFTFYVREVNESWIVLVLGFHFLEELKVSAQLFLDLEKYVRLFELVDSLKNLLIKLGRRCWVGMGACCNVSGALDSWKDKVGRDGKCIYSELPFQKMDLIWQSNVQGG